jgi:Transposase zinc-binding domain
VTRPPWEVADVIRRTGSKFLERYRASLTWAQVKVLTAIVRCRTAALGGHRDRCMRCGYQAISYNSCLMGSIFFSGVERQRGVPQAVSRPFDSPLRVALQKREQFVGWPEPALAEAGRHNRFNGLQLFSRVGSNVNLRRGQTTVPQPQ